MLNKTLITITYNSSNIEDLISFNNIKVMMIKKIQYKMTNNVINNEIWYLGNSMKYYKYNIKS